MKKTIAILMLGVLLFSCAGCIYANEAPTLYIRLGDQTIEQLAYISESYLTTQLERGFATLDFYKSLQPLND